MCAMIRFLFWFAAGALVSVPFWLMVLLLISALSVGVDIGGE